MLSELGSAVLSYTVGGEGGRTLIGLTSAIAPACVVGAPCAERELPTWNERECRRGEGLRVAGFEGPAQVYSGVSCEDEGGGEEKGRGEERESGGVEMRDVEVEAGFNDEQRCRCVACPGRLWAVTLAFQGPEGASTEWSGWRSP
jgi:hypothetical protein